MTNRSMRTRAFTLIELLVVISIIAVLLVLLSVALLKGRKSAMRGLAQRQVTTIATAVDQFKSDFDYYPPLLVHPFPAGTPAPVNGFEQSIVPEALYRTNPVAYRDALKDARWHSTVSLTVYLAGVGNINLDQGQNGEPLEIYDNRTTPEVEPNYDDGADGPGIRSPGIDQSWGGAADRSIQKNPATGGRVVPPTGRVYGPYLDIGSLGDLLQRRDDGLYEILDPFDNRVRYYRNWPVTDPDAAKHIQMVPAELRSAESVTAQFLVDDQEDVDTATQIDRSLLTAPYIVLGAGMSVENQYENSSGQIEDIEPFGDVLPKDGLRYEIQVDSPSEKFDRNTCDDAGITTVGDPTGVRKILLRYLETNVKGGV